MTYCMILSMRQYCTVLCCTAYQHQSFQSLALVPFQNLPPFRVPCSTYSTELYNYNQQWYKLCASSTTDRFQLIATDVAMSYHELNTQLPQYAYYACPALPFRYSTVQYTVHRIQICSTSHVQYSPPFKRASTWRPLLSSVSKYLPQSQLCMIL